MVSWPIITVALSRDIDIIPVRQRARAIAAELGFDVQDQTRIATAVSEIARNALFYAGGGKVEFVIHPRPNPPRLVIIVSDRGPGIADLEGVLAGTVQGEAGLGLGIAGARRLMDAVAIDSRPGSTVVRLEKRLPPSHWGIAAPRLGEIARRLAGVFPDDVLGEVQAQNQELMRSLNELRIKQEETTRLNQELERTNQGVVALYAELDQKAIELQTLNATLEDRVARAISQQEEAEANLRQSQKMEAVGQLTGGLAHDFNNLLQIIIGNLDVLVRKLPEQDARLRRSAASAMEGARRAATLTQRLLAFSRRQPLQPQPVAAGDLVQGMLELLQRTLGETISIVTEFAPDLALIEVDPNQLENALVNLTVNARDAMTEGGSLRLRTRNTRGPVETAEDGATSQVSGSSAAAGEMRDYVAIEVSDDGCGMAPDTLARAFEPFFTTKDVGKGTGLGLSMVYGFVKQSGGNVRVTSEEGKGTTVVLLFPAVSAKAIAPVTAAARRPVRDIGGKTILVVEDDADVRAYTCEALRELGCVVIEAQEGAGALAAIRDHPGIDLLFTDVVLPGGIFGRELVDRALAARPGLKVLFTTGYERDQIVHMGRLDPGISVLPKPFTSEALAERIGAVLSLDEREGAIPALS